MGFGKLSCVHRVAMQRPIEVTLGEGRATGRDQGEGDLRVCDDPRAVFTQRGQVELVALGDDVAAVLAAVARRAEELRLRDQRDAA
ncbi:MAG TPA: hypothetical protein VFX59_08485, partial [Polyangiales bacterium]|nr:hypothetical protein [Polyangiales bacterium]